MLSFSALRIPTYAVSILGGSLFRMAISTVPFLLPLMFQIGFGLSAFHAGLLVLVVFAGNLGMKPATTPVLRRFGFRTTLLGNGLITAASLIACGTLSPTTPLAIMLVVLFVGGLCRSMQFTGIMTLAFADVPKPELSAANSLSSVVQQMTMGMGIALGALTLRAASMLRGETGSPLTLGDFHIAFWLAGGLTLVALIDVLRLRADAGATVSGHRATPGIATEKSPQVP